MPPPFPLRTYSFAEYLYFTIHHKNWLLKIVGEDSYFFLQHLKIKASSWPQNLFSSLERPSVSVGGTHRRLGGQRQQGERNYMANALSTGQTGESAVVLLDAGCLERQTNNNKKSPHRWNQWHFLLTTPFRKDKPSNSPLPATHTVLLYWLYWPGELIIDCGPSAYKYARKLFKVLTIQKMWEHSRV